MKPIGEDKIPQPGEVVLSKYRVERVIGEGGMGVVLAIRHTDLGELFAMKLLRPASAERPGATARFVREARAAARLRSDHVARVYDVGTLPNGTPYMLMEYLDGLDLASILSAHGALSHADVVDYVSQALDAIGEAHSLGLVHRDLKPGNLFLSAKPSGATSLKVLDFGISKELSAEEGAPSMTQSGDLVGSPYYMSPEQMRGAKDVDTRADIWALGVIMFELLTDMVPFPGKTSTQVCSAVLEGPLPSIRALVPDLPEELASVISKCLRRDREQRFESAEELAAALARVPKAFDGSRSNRTRKLLAESRPPPSSGKKASLASIALTKSAVSRSNPNLGAVMQEESVALARDRRADPETPPGGVKSKAAITTADATLRGSSPELLGATRPSARPPATRESAPPSSARAEAARGDSLPDSLPNASLPGVSEVPTGEPDEALGSKPPRSRALLFGSVAAVVLAACALIYVITLSRSGASDRTAEPPNASSAQAITNHPTAGGNEAPSTSAPSRDAMATPSSSPSTAASASASSESAATESAGSGRAPAAGTGVHAASPSSGAAMSGSSASAPSPKPSASVPAPAKSSAPSTPKPASSHEGIY